MKQINILELEGTQLVKAKGFGSTEDNYKKAKVAYKWKQGNRYPLINVIKSGAPYGIIVPNNIVVLDVDDEENMIAMDRLMASKGWHTFTYKTMKGKHYWFNATDEVLSLIEEKVIANSSCVHCIASGFIQLQLSFR